MSAACSSLCHANWPPDFTKLLIYLVFFIAILINYGLPLHILRDVYMTLRSFIARGSDFLRYRRATRNMDTLYPDASTEELDRLGDKTCIICREEMVARDAGESADDGPNMTPKKLTCGHIFHFHCLRTWLERQQSCPTCRRDVLNMTPVPRRDGLQQPPPPAPGAVPVPPGAAHPDHPPTPEGARALEFEEYFRLPAVNGDAPPPLHAPPGVAPPAATRTAAPAAVEVEETEEVRVQRGIWGAPIIPGRFLAQTPIAPLRAIPGLDQARVVPPPTGVQEPATPGPSGLVSGTTTPFSSQSPVVFSSTGSPRRSADATPQKAAAAEPAEATPEDDDVPTFDDDDIPIREAIARAALRRAGGSAPVDKGKTPERAVEPAPAVAAPAAAAVPRDTSFDAVPTHHAYLTPVSLPPPHLPQVAAGQSVVRAVPQTTETTRRALDERLAALRDIDQVVWGLVGEMSRLKSAWELEDGAGAASDTVQVSTPPTSPDASSSAPAGL